MKNELLSLGKKTTFKEGQLIIKQGDKCDVFLFLLKGKIKVIARSKKGKEFNLYHINPSDICVLTTSCLISNDLFPAEAVAETDIEALILNKNDFNRILNESDFFRKSIFDNFGNRLKDLIIKIEEIASDPVITRLAKYLKNNQNQGAVNTTHSEIASQIFAAREVVSRALKKMQNKGVIEITRNHIKIIDIRALDDYIL